MKMLKASALAILFLFSNLTLFAANIGTVVPVVGQVADLVYDPGRNLVYLANTSRNEVDIYSIATGKLAGSIHTGLQPASLALSPDGNTLFSANIGSFSVSVISLITQQVANDYFIGSRPDAIAAGSDGTVIILGTAGLLRMDPGSGQTTPVPIAPSVATPVGLPTPSTSATPAGFLAGLVTTANGNLIVGLSSTRIFVYEVASGTVLRSRTVSGLRAILSASPDGSRFMAGPFLFDTQSLAILGRAGTVSTTLTGGSSFSVDGNDVYATFSTQPAINPLNTNNPQNAAVPGIIGVPTATTTGSVLQIMRASSLTPELGLRLAEPITSKIIASPDGANLFANSTSGILVVPVGQLANLPILGVSATNVVLTVDTCNRTIATASVQIQNIGGGRMTFSATVNNATAPIVLNQRTGVAPATLNISFTPPTNATRGTLQYVVVIASAEAVNVEPAILVNVNFRDVTDRGTIVPMTGVGVDMQMDTARKRLYIANYTQDQVEVFSLASQTFLPPIRVGNRPRSMAIIDSSTLVVANSGGENLSIVDLNLLEEIDQIGMGPIPLNATPIFPRSIAASANAILFSAVPLPATAGLAGGTGSIWQLSLVTHSAFPRLDLGIGATNSVQGLTTLVAPDDGSGILLVEGNGTLLLYDPISDTFPVTRTGALTGTLRGTLSAAADGSFFVIDNSVFNSVLVSQGALAAAPGAVGAAAAAVAAFGVVVSGTNVIRVQAATTQTPVQTLQRFNLSTLQPNLQVNLPESVMDITPAATGTRQWPPRQTALELGINNQTELLPRGMAADSSNNVYALTFSGLSVVSVTPATGPVPSFTANGVVNSASKARLVSPGSLVTINGSNLADADQASATPLPQSLGGICVTANEVAIPLLITSPTQVQAQLPPNILPGPITLTVRSTKLGLTSAGVQVAVTAAGPGLFTMDIGDGLPRATLFHSVDGALVTPDYPAERDETLVLYGVGFGPVSPQVPAGELNPANPISPTTAPITVSIGGRPYEVLSSSLAPGFVGVYSVTLYVPGNRVQGDALPVVVTAGGVSSTTNATNDPPLAAIH